MQYFKFLFLSLVFSFCFLKSDDKKFEEINEKLNSAIESKKDIFSLNIINKINFLDETIDYNFHCIDKKNLENYSDAFTNNLLKTIIGTNPAFYTIFNEFDVNSKFLLKIKNEKLISFLNETSLKKLNMNLLDYFSEEFNDEQIKIILNEKKFLNNLNELKIEEMQKNKFILKIKNKDIFKNLNIESIKRLSPYFVYFFYKSFDKIQFKYLLKLNEISENLNGIDNTKKFILNTEEQSKTIFNNENLDILKTKSSNEIDCIIKCKNEFLKYIKENKLLSEISDENLKKFNLNIISYLFGEVDTINELKRILSFEETYEKLNKNIQCGEEEKNQILNEIKKNIFNNNLVNLKYFSKFNANILNYIFNAFESNRLFDYSNFYINLNELYTKNNEFNLTLNSIKENEESNYEYLFSFLKKNISDNVKIFNLKNDKFELLNNDKFFKNLNINIINKIIENQKDQKIKNGIVSFYLSQKEFYDKINKKYENIEIKIDDNFYLLKELKSNIDKYKIDFSKFSFNVLEYFVDKINNEKLYEILKNKKNELNNTFKDIEVINDENSGSLLNKLKNIIKDNNSNNKYDIKVFSKNIISYLSN